MKGVNDVGITSSFVHLFVFVSFFLCFFVSLSLCVCLSLSLFMAGVPD